MDFDLGVPEQPKLGQLPLRIALCQLRFPSLLGLEAKELRPLAQALFDDYPNSSEDQLQSVQLELSPAGIRQQGSQPQTAFRFESAEGTWSASLTRDWLSLETTSYQGFRDFAERWYQLLQEARRVLPIGSETRLGLRYVNEIKAGPDATPDHLATLLTPEVLGPVVLDNEATSLLRSWQEVRFRHDDGGCTLQHGYVQNADQEWVYVLDFDGFREGKRDIDDEEQVRALGQINHHIFQLFKSCLTDETFQSFDPEEPAS